MTLLEMVKHYQTLLETKERLAAETKENNAAIEAAKAQIAQQMVDDDCPKISTGGSAMFATISAIASLHLSTFTARSSSPGA